MATCTPDKENLSLGSKPTADFTVTPLSGNANRVVINNTSSGEFMHSFDFGNGVKSSKNTDTVLYDAKGDYTVTLTAFGQGGYVTTTKKVSIANDYPGEEILKGGDMSSSSAQYWTRLTIGGGTQTTMAFVNDALKLSNTGDANGGIYQAVQVKAGKTYIFSATVKGDGATNTWVEVYFGTTAPAQGADYTDNNFIALNTWSGCGGSPFNGNLATIGCAGNGVGKSGRMTFSQSGTVYLVIKAGSCCGGNMGNGITIDDISLREK
jgi:PKD repeat protein